MLLQNEKNEAEVIWQRLHRMTPHTLHAAEFSRVTDRLTDRLTNLRTDTAIIGNSSLHLMGSMQPENYRFNGDMISR